MSVALESLADLDLGELLTLNNRHRTELSELDHEEFARLAAAAFRARETRAPASFLLAFDQDAPYASPNFLWFKARLPRFVYVDRVVVAADGRRLGLARRLYADLFDNARAAGHTIIAAEVNSDPPNPSSDAFHARLGFEEIGRARLDDRGKTVRYLVRGL
jgi:predicted GNAT superfamily acetyltransferase